MKRTLAVALRALACGPAGPASAQEKGDGAVSLFLAYRCASMYLNHHTAGGPWDSLLVLEYAGTAGLAQRELVKDGVRRRLAQDPAWKTLSDSKQNVRSEGQVVVAEPLVRP